MERIAEAALGLNHALRGLPQANPRLEHESKIWEDVTLPADRVLVPGVVTHHTTVVEPPEGARIASRQLWGEKAEVVTS